ncbi:glycogen synthase [Chloroflexota bacterium]
MNRKLRILFAAAEISSLVKIGGLADVAGALPKALHQLGHDVALIMPRYGNVDLKEREMVPKGSLNIPMMGRSENVSIIETFLDDMIPVYLLENEKYFNRPSVYGEGDDQERFYLFSLAILEVSKQLGWRPNILHCNDWHTAFTLPLLKVAHKDDAFYASCASVFTIHNLAHQGRFDDYFAESAGLYDYLPAWGDPLRSKAYSMMALGIFHSDIVSTVSETYAQEILTIEYGEGLEGMLQSRQDSLFGIVNGIDYEQFNPATDPLIAANYDVETIATKAKNKAALQEKAGLAVDVGVPLVGMVGRLAAQKGLDILLESFESMLTETDVQFVLLGTGIGREADLYKEILQETAARYPERVHVFLTFDLTLAQLIYSGCDIYLMPSRFEPCGLGQLIAMRYGTIPVVRRTGGLAETVQDCTSDLSKGNGFAFGKYDAGELLSALKRAVAGFHSKEVWRGLVIRAMQAEYSWEISARKYEALYWRALSKNR